MRRCSSPTRTRGRPSVFATHEIPPSPGGIPTVDLTVHVRTPLPVPGMRAGGPGAGRLPHARGQPGAARGGRRDLEPRRPAARPLPPARRDPALAPGNFAGQPARSRLPKSPGDANPGLARADAAGALPARWRARPALAAAPSPEELDDARSASSRRSPTTTALRARYGDALFQAGDALESLRVLNPGREPTRSWVVRAAPGGGRLPRPRAVRRRAPRAARGDRRSTPDDASHLPGARAGLRGGAPRGHRARRRPARSGEADADAGARAEAGDRAEPEPSAPRAPRRRRRPRRRARSTRPSRCASRARAAARRALRARARRRARRRRAVLVGLVLAVRRGAARARRPRRLDRAAGGTTGAFSVRLVARARAGAPARRRAPSPRRAPRRASSTSSSRARRTSAASRRAATG